MDSILGVRVIVFLTTIACAFSLISYPDYAQARGWRVGALIDKDTGWVRIGSLVALVGTLIISFLEGSWWHPIVLLPSGWGAAYASVRLLREAVQAVALLGGSLAWILTLSGFGR